MPLRARLALVLAGLLLLGVAGWKLLTFRPLSAGAAAASPPAGRRPGFGEPAAGMLAVRQEGGNVPPSASAPARTPPLTETTNILLAGLDTRADSFSGGRTDSLTVLVLDDKSPHLGLVSIPRDLEVQLEGHEPERINAVYAIGTREGGGADAGDALLRKTIREVIGLPIAHAVYVDHAGFEALVDELDGISVQVRCPSAIASSTRAAPTAGSSCAWRPACSTSTAAPR
jgi:LCP family protein required for cell wall assembly